MSSAESAQAIDEHFEKYEKAPSYEELVPLGRTYHFFDPDDGEYDENGDEREPLTVHSELEIAQTVAGQWRLQLEGAINEVGDTAINDWTWHESILVNAEESMGIGFEEGWHDSDPEHPAAERARHLAELDLIRWLCKRHSISLSEVTANAIEDRKSRIIRDLRTAPST